MGWDARSPQRPPFPVVIGCIVDDCGRDVEALLPPRLQHVNPAIFEEPSAKAREQIRKPKTEKQSKADSDALVIVPFVLVLLVS